MLLKMLTRLSLASLLLALGLWASHQAGSAAPTVQNENGRIYLPVINGGNRQSTPPPVTLPPLPETATPTPPATKSAATDQELIAAALAAGQIDYATSLLYRAYALFSDDRLPVALRGAGSRGEDQTLFSAAADPNLPAAVQAQLRPFLLRPDHPESVHSLQPISTTQASVAAGLGSACSGPWAAQSSAQPGVKIRVHARCHGNYNAAIQQVIGVMETLWTPMTTHMGPPVLDNGGPGGGSTDDIDIYLLDPLDTLVRNSEAYSITPGLMAAALSSVPYNGDHASGFMLVGRSNIGAPGFKSTLAHEFFHVLQDAHNYDVSFHDSTEWWFTEASATWAEGHFVPETADTEVHWRFTDSFKRLDNPLHLSLDTEDAAQADQLYSMYGAYIWPFFIEQELGAKAIAEIWQKLETVGEDWDKALQVIDDKMPFARDFHRFALRNINNSFGSDNPLGKRYVDLDPKFPDGALPIERYFRHLTPMALKSSLALTDTIPALRAHYYHFTIDPTVQQVVFDFTRLQPLLDRKVGALVKIKGQPWQMRELLSDVVRFCRDNPAEDIEEIWIVASHHNTDLASKVKGPLLVRAYKEPCGCDPALLEKFMSVERWQARLTFNYQQRAEQGKHMAQIRELADIGGQLTAYADFSYIGKTVTGTAQINYVETRDKEVIEQVNGNGAVLPYDAVFNGATQFSRITLNFRPRDCTYSFGATAYITATNTAGQPFAAAVGSVGGWFRPLPEDSLSLIGLAGFDTHTEEFILNYEGDFFSAYYDFALRALLGEENLGLTQVSWKFEPAPPPE